MESNGTMQSRTELLLCAVVLLVLPAACARVEGVSTGPVVLTGDVPAVQYDAENRELVIAMAPVQLPAHAGHDAIQQAAALTAELPAGGWLHGYKVDVIDRSGQPVPRSVIHHVNLMAPDRREFFSNIMQRIGAVGSETGSVMMPRVLGYPVRKGERIIVIAELHNPTGSTFEGARVLVRMPHTPEGAWPPPIPVHPFYMDVTEPAELHSFDLPPGRSEQSWEARAPMDGRILGMGGHLHERGIELRLEDVTAGKVVWRTAPILDEEGRLVGMPQARLWWKLGIPVEGGHVYRLVSVYENDSGSVLPEGGMGALGGVLVPERGVEWPSADPSHAEYQKDIANRITGRDRAPMQGAPAGHGGHTHRD
jgi:hypothetical protein